jgi:two-component system sensor histidine kinase KdpD
MALLACGIATALAELLVRVFDISNVVALFLFTVVLVALRWGKLAGSVAALVGVTSFDFFFVPPVFAFRLSDAQYLFTFVLTLVIALVIGQLVARIRAEAASAVAGERRAVALAEVARDLSATSTVRQIDSVCSHRVAPLFGATGVLLQPDGQGRMADIDGAIVSAPSVGGVTHEVPLISPTHARGVLAFRRDAGWTLREDDQRLLEACCALVAQALDRVHFTDEARDTLVRMEGERFRHTLLAAVSHDLKTPLTAIRGLAETLELGNASSLAEGRDMARAIRRQADAMQRQVGNLLDLARMQDEGTHLELDWHDAGEVVGSALAAMDVVLGHRPVNIEWPPDLPLLRMDARLFEHVIINLLDNAAKHTPASASIWIRAHKGEDHLMIDVEDDGPGLPPDVAKHIPTITCARNKPGMGLGLALCQSIVRAHGGSMEVLGGTSRGVCFRVSLPIEDMPELEREIP